MRIRLLLLVGAVLGITTLHAETKTVTTTSAGTLASFFTEQEKTTVDNLTISGKLNKTDFDFLRDGLSALTSLDVENVDIEAVTIKDADNNETIYPADEFPAYGLDSKKTLTAIKMPKSITSIGAYAMQFTSIQELNLASHPNLVTIKEYAYYSTPYVKAIDLSNCTKLTDIEQYAFNTAGDATKLGEIGVTETAINLSGCSALKNVGDYTFANIKLCTSVDFTGCSALETLGNRTFLNNAMTSLDLTDCVSLKNIPDYSFYYTKKIKTMILPPNVESIGSKSFYTLGTPDLTSVTCNTTAVPTIGTSAFGSTAYKNATLYVAESLIESYKAVAEWAKFSAIEKAIKQYNVATAGTLSTLVSEQDKATIKEVKISGNLNKVDFNFINTEMTALTSLDLEDANIVAVTIKDADNNETIYPADEFPAYGLDSKKTLTAIKMPKSITSIGAYAMQFTSIQELNLASHPNLVTIKEYAYYSTPYVKAIDLSNCTKLTDIEQYAFNTAGDATKLGEIGVTETAINLSGCSALKNVGDYTFANIKLCTSVDFTGCSALETLGNRTFLNNAMTSLDLTDCVSLKNIPDYSFYYTKKIKTMILPPNVESIGSKSFYTLGTPDLTSVTCNTTAVPTIGTSAFGSTAYKNATLHVPASLIESYKADAEWSKFVNIADVTGVAGNKASSIKVYANGMNIEIQGLEPMSNVVIYNINGQMIQEATVNATEVSFNMPAQGIYVVKCQNELFKVAL